MCFTTVGFLRVPFRDPKPRRHNSCWRGFAKMGWSPTSAALVNEFGGLTGESFEHNYIQLEA